MYPGRGEGVTDGKVKTDSSPQKPDEKDSRDIEAKRNLDVILAREDEAERILNEGQVIPFFRKVYSTLHSGDVAVIDTLLLAFASQSILNSSGIQPALSGPRGTGKTTALQAGLHLVPPDLMISGSFSNKGLFYHVKNPGSVLFSDDTELGDELCSFFKRAMSNFQYATHHHTVGDRGSPRTVTVPPRCMFLFTSIGDAGDDQLSDRQYRISLEKTPEGNRAYSEFLLDQAEKGMEEYPVTEEVLICRRILELLRCSLFRVRIPFSKQRILFNDPDNRRDMKLYLDFIKAAAVIHYRKRASQPFEDNVIEIEATLEDAILARDIFRVTAQGRKYRLTKEERGLWEFIWELQKKRDEWIEGVPFPEIVREWSGKTDKSTARNVERLLIGRDGKGGLLDKVPGLTVESTVIIDTQNRRNQGRIVSCDRAPIFGDYDEFITILDGQGSPIKGSLPGSRTVLNQADALALYESVKGDPDQLTPEQQAAIRKYWPGQQQDPSISEEVAR